ncbi:hypothetical protein OsJ_05381 [Oryza sativa Japonica Group]|uniref:Uncharacterized protein n=1 Tax=Oryza sativa subsp. japonica TaxID=39947 RepID=A3A357_ORYSJ|nr:hypothetical protein OsJ_05381 [Oryza sativa Japonica Group]
MADKEIQSRLAWHLSCCFQEDTGRPPFPHCGEGSDMVHCRKRLGVSEDQVFLETNTLCHQLQAEASLGVPLRRRRWRRPARFLCEGGKASASGCLQGGESSEKYSFICNKYRC